MDFKDKIKMCCNERTDLVRIVNGRLEFLQDLHAADAVNHSFWYTHFRTAKQVPQQSWLLDRDVRGDRTDTSLISKITDDAELIGLDYNTVLALIPVTFLLIFTPFELWRQAGNQVCHIPWNFMNSMKVILLCIQSNLIIMMALYEVFHSNHPSVFNITVQVILFLTQLHLLYLVKRGKKKGAQTSYIMCTYWLIQTTCSIIDFQSNNSSTFDHWKHKLKIFSFVINVFQLIIATGSCSDHASTNHKDKPLNPPNMCPEDNCSIVSKLSFSWLNPLMRKGYERSLTREDLWCLVPNRQCKKVSERFESYWEHTPNFQRINEKMNVIFYSLSVFNVFLCVFSISRPHVIFSLLKTFWLQLLFGAILKLASTILMTASPKILSWIIQYMASDGALYVGVYYACMLFAVMELSTLFHQHHCYQMYSVAFGCRSSLICAIYKKAHKISPEAQKSLTIGEMINVLSNDTQQFVPVMPLINLLWCSPLEILIVIYFLWQILGSAVFAGVLIIVIMIPINGLIEKITHKVQVKSIKSCNQLPVIIGGNIHFYSRDSEFNEIKALPDSYKIVLASDPSIGTYIGYNGGESISDQIFALDSFSMVVDVLALKDERIKIVTEIMNGIRILKLYAWETPYMNKVVSVREREMNGLKKIAYLNASTMLTWYSCTFLVSIVTFATYIHMSDSNILTTEMAFVAITLFSVLRYPIIVFPQTISRVMKLKVSLDRINKFLHSEELDSDLIEHDSSYTDDPISVKGASFTWEKSSKNPVLKDISLTVAPNSLVAVIGKVGCGKSSLISALLGEMYKLKGQVNLKGNVAYVPQTAWIRNATVKKNIIMYKSENQSKYEEILNACELQYDLDVLPSGDISEIGEKGVNLSGGQKQRISLARAIYHEADVYFFDDPLSAVDSHVGKKIFENVISQNGLLKNVETLCYSLGSKPWSLANGDGTLKKTDKLSLSRHIEKESVKIDVPTGKRATVMDAIAIVQSAHRENLTFNELNQNILKRILTDGHGSERINVVFDVYVEQSIKAAERVNRGSYNDITRFMVTHNLSYLPYCDKILVVNKGTVFEANSYESLMSKNCLFSESFLQYHNETGETQDQHKIPDLYKSIKSCEDDTKAVKSGEILDLKEESNYSKNCKSSHDLPKRNSVNSSEASKFKLITEEEIQAGSVSWTVYYYYMKTVGLPAFFFLTVAWGLAESSFAGSRIWIKQWSDGLPSENFSKIHEFQHKKIAIYSLFGLAEGSNLRFADDVVLFSESPQELQLTVEELRTANNKVDLEINETIFVFIASNGFAFIISKTSAILHENMLTSLMKSPVSFFDTTPVGRILNRFTKDMEILDNELLWDFTDVIKIAMKAFFAALVISVNFPKFLIIIILINVLYFYLQKIFIASSRQLVRLQLTTHSRLQEHYSESLNGKASIRAYKLQNEMIKETYAKIDLNQIYCFSYLAAQRPWATPSAANAAMVKPMMKMTENELSKASFFGHIARGSAGEELKMIVAEGWRKVGRGRGRRRRRWMDDVELVTGTKDVRKNIEMAKDKERWREKWLTIRTETLGNISIFFVAMFAVLNKDFIDGTVVGLAISSAMVLKEEMNWLIRMISSLENHMVSAERVLEYSNLPSESCWNKETPSFDWLKEGKIEFCSYSSRYHKHLDLSLRNITCCIYPGEKIGICGRTGAGKTSLSLALFRIIEAAEGRILIDGFDISCLGLHDLRSKLTIIPQVPTIFSGTLKQNIDPFEEYDELDIWRALKQSHMKSFVSSLKDGLQFQVCEDGTNLSVGQRQLMCMTRALLRKTKILILDEATAAVDVETDKIIQETIRNEFKECTILTIAHRLNTIMDSSRVMVLEHGEIAEFDSPSRLLMNKDTIFYRLAKDANLVTSVKTKIM
ncbi:Multidrug resistance-associated protein 1 [Nymphon striatum]|nr:Multidrug resistance-associated protein 1 [Nymphon striatum]